MEEKIIVLKEDDYKTIKDALIAIGEELNFPSYYSSNLDSLNDCLSEISYPITFIIVSNKEYNCSDWIYQLFSALKTISEDNELIKVIFKES